VNLVFFKVSYPRRSENAYFLVVWTLKVLKDNLPFFPASEYLKGNWRGMVFLFMGQARALPPF
jgi:hypothetical protein